MNEEGAPFDSGFDDAGPFSVTPEADGVALDAALREFGPAAFDDLLPRLRNIAADLDAAHTVGFIHGRLHPSKVFVTDDATYLLGARVPLVLEDRRDWPIYPPYTAPEVVGGGKPGPTADQYSLAAIAYEWMFGRPITGPAERAVDVRAIPNVDRGELVRAFTRALAPEPFRRFASCTDFCDAIAAASAPSLPLVAASADDVEKDLEPFQPESPAPAPVVVAAEPVADFSFPAEESRVTPVEPDLDSFDRVAEPPPQPLRSAAMVDPDLNSVTADRPVPSRPERFSGLALILATIVGAVFGFAAGYMARPRALQTPVASVVETTTAQGAQGAKDAQGAKGAQGAEGAQSAKGAQGAEGAQGAATGASGAGAAGARGATGSTVAATNIGQLLVRSNPSGATVEVDGVSRGVTPLAVRDLDLGSRQITVSRRGYVSEERRVTLTKARPSRSVEVRLVAVAANTAPSAAPRPSTPASLGKPAVTTGALAIESRPSGASVTVNGNPVGTTPLTLDNLAPGEYRVTMTLPGFQDFATTVRVVAGERARAAARLTEQEQE